MKRFFTLLLALLSLHFLIAQNLQVSTLIEDINASGGVTFGPDGNIYVSDFGNTSPPDGPTKVFKMENESWVITTFAEGFEGASGSCFDAAGNFYQSNPFGGKVSKVSVDGTVELDWAVDSMSLPVGIQQGLDGNFYVCDCALNKIIKILPDGTSSTFIDSDELVCPNGMTIDPDGNLYVCNYVDAKVFRITPDGTMTELAQLPRLFGGPSVVGAGHLVWKNNFLFVTTIGTGQIFKVDMEGNQQLIAGVANSFSNTDGPALQATFSKPNGIAASITGDTLFVNVSENSWISNPASLHPSHLRMITGVCSLTDVDCTVISQNKEQKKMNSGIEISPNPATEEVEISWSKTRLKGAITLEVLDMNGKVIHQASLRDTTTYHLSLEGISNGMHLVVLKGNDQTLSQKLMVQ